MVDATPSQYAGPLRMVQGARRLTHDSVALLFIALCWITAVILVNPVGEFPVVDDWSYYLAVRALVEQGTIRFSDWTGVNLLSQVFWGGLFSLPFGVSYTALRISTLVAALLGALALYRLIRETEQPVSIALLAALSLLFNPIFFPLSLSFMTDVPFVAVQAGAILFLFAGLRSGSRAMSAVGWGLALVALLCRQTALAIPIAYAATYLTKHGLGTKRIAVAALPLVIFAAVQWGYQYLLTITGKLPPLFGENLNSAVPILMSSASAISTRIFEVARYIFFYLGLFLLPMSLPAVAAIVASLPRRAGTWVAVVIAVVSAILAAAAFLGGLVMPIWPHTWRTWGIGADSHGVVAPKLVLEILTVVAVFGGVLLVVNLMAGLRAAVGVSRRDKWMLVFSLVGPLALAGVLCLITIKFDRYLLPMLPWLALAVAFAMSGVRSPVPRWSLIVSTLFLAGMAWYCIVSGHNYVVGKRTWMKAISDLVAEGIPRDRIDATWVLNGEELYGYGHGERTAARKTWYASRDYVVGVWPEPNYKLLRRYPVEDWPIWGSTGPDILVYGPKETPK